MSVKPALADLESALRAAGQAHHDYEGNFLNGEADKQWAGWYAGYCAWKARRFHLADFTRPHAGRGPIRGRLGFRGCEPHFAAALASRGGINLTPTSP